MLSEEVFFAHVRTWHCKILVCEGQNPFANTREETPLVKLETDESANELNENLDSAQPDVGLEDNQPAEREDNEPAQPEDNEDNQLDDEMFDSSQGDIGGGDVCTNDDNNAFISTTNMDTSDAVSNLLTNEAVDFNDMPVETENTTDLRNLESTRVEVESHSQATELDTLFQSARGYIFSKCLTTALLSENQEAEKPFRVPKRIVYNLPLQKNSGNKLSADFSFQSLETEEEIPFESILSETQLSNEASITAPSHTISFDLGKKTYKNYCHICAKQFKTKSLYETHERTHSLVRPFACPHPNCSATFTRKTHLAVHQRKHTGVRPFACVACPATFTQSNCLRVHMERIHNLVEKKAHNCNLCGKAFSTPVGVKTHKEKKHKYEK